MDVWIALFVRMVLDLIKPRMFVKRVKVSVVFLAQEMLTFAINVIQDLFWKTLHNWFQQKVRKTQLHYVLNAAKIYFKDVNRVYLPKSVMNASTATSSTIVTCVRHKLIKSGLMFWWSVSLQEVFYWLQVKVC